MIKVYLDWNIICRLNNEYLELQNFLLSDKNRFLLPYSHAHILDLLNCNDMNYVDEYIQNIRNNMGSHFMTLDGGVICDVVEVYNNFLPMQKILFSLNDFITLNVIDKETRLETNCNNWCIGEVIPKLKEHLKNNKNSFDELIINFSGYIDNLLGNNINTKTIEYISIYIILGLYGYMSDKKSFINMITDALHSYFSQYCNYFITNDSKLMSKTKVLYDYYNIGEETILANHNDFIESIKNHLI